jgi:hypothetical protein
LASEAGVVFLGVDNFGATGGAIKSRKAILSRVATDRIMVMGYFSVPGYWKCHPPYDTAYHWEAAQWAR